MFNQARIGMGIVVLLLCGPSIDQATAECQVESGEPGSQGVLKIHLGTACTQAERESRAIDATTLMAALQREQTVDLSGVVVRGDLALDALPVSSSPPLIEGVISREDKEVRVIAGGLSIVNSVVHGSITHRSAGGTLAFMGPVTFAGTTFEQMVDLSRSVFSQPVTLSGSIFLRESYFVQGRFLREMAGEKTAFGSHTRFHRSQFNGPVTFQQSGFRGLAEFLEVRFDGDANLSRTYFKAGTGFSGSQFKGLADFSEALFDGDAFFTFTRFDGDVFFRRATFRATADFDDAQFNAREDFSKVFFEKGPQFARTKRSAQKPEALGIENPQIQYAITLSLLLFSALLIAYLIRSR
jgi:hypothetical protein